MITLSTFYQSKAWVNLMQMIKSERSTASGELICEHCGKPIVRKYDCIGHHKIHLTESNVNDAEASAGVITRGVADLWNYGSGNADFSPYFRQRAIQLTFKEVKSDEVESFEHETN